MLGVGNRETMCPIYEYKCNNCNRETTVIGASIKDGNFIDCPDCGALAGKKISIVSVTGSKKQWSGRKQVNFHVDDRKTIAEKQVAMTVNSGRLDKFCNDRKLPGAMKKRYLKTMGKMIKNAPPVKLEL